VAKNALVLAAVALVGGLWGVLAGMFIAQRMPRKPPVPSSFHLALTYGLTLGIVTGAAMAVVVAMQLQHGGAWMILTIIVVAQPGLHRTWTKTRDRLIGTALGFAIALAVGLVITQTTLVLLAGLLFMAISAFILLESGRPYWQFVTFLTPAIVLVEGAGTDVVATDMARIWFTVLGAAIAVAVLFVFRAVGMTDAPTEVVPS
jgi:uncharacterized membrane protein YccC